MGWTRWIGIAEAIWGLCLTTMVALLGIGIGAAVVLFPVNRQGHFYGSWWVFRIIGWLAALLCGFKSVAICGQSISRAMVPGSEPGPLLTADRLLLPTSLPLRPFVAVWWLGLACGTLIFSKMLYIEFEKMSSVRQSFAWRTVIFVLFEYPGTVAANTNILTAVAAATGSRTTVRALFRMRLLLDVALTALLYFSPSIR